MSRITSVALSACFFLLTSVCFAQPKADYYKSEVLNGKSGRELELALKSIIYPHQRIRYENLWTAFETSDPGPTDSIPAGNDKTDLVYDMYAWMLEFPKFYSDAIHTTTGGFNREHCVPNSWWGGKNGNTFAYSDLHHLVPADGAANSAAKNDNPLGEYTDGLILGWPTDDVEKDGHKYVSKLNPCSRRWSIPSTMQSQYCEATSLFEPTDQYKGDFARMYLYVVCAYEKELVWKTNYMFVSSYDSLTTIQPWAKDLLLKWHRQDPVSSKERARNNAVETLQENRNPFIDYPELVEYIWGDKTGTDLDFSTLTSSYETTYSVIIHKKGSVKRIDGVAAGTNIKQLLTNYEDDECFYGWSLTESADLTNMLPSSATLNAVVDVYAIYKQPSYKYKLVESQLADWRGDYVVAYSQDVMMDGSLPGGTSGIGKSSSYVTPKVFLNKTENTLAESWGNQYYVTVEAIDDDNLSKGYVIKTHNDASPYFYQSSNSNGMSATGKKSTAAKYPITFTYRNSHDISIALGGSAAGAELRYKPSDKVFRFYKDASNEPVYLYKKVQSEPVYTLARQFNVSLSEVDEHTWGTLYLDYAVTVPSSLDVYYATYETPFVRLHPVGDVLPAQTGAVLRGTEVSCTLSETSDSNPYEEDITSANCMVGYTKDTDVGGNMSYSYYALNYSTVATKKTVGFFVPNGAETPNDTFTAQAYKAYLQLPSTQESKAVTLIIDGEPTTMSQVISSDVNPHSAGYDVTGRPVNGNYRGLMIKGGAKYLQR